jgi:hypothetical protein
LSVGPTGPTEKVFFVKFSFPVNFVVLIRVAYMDPDPGKWSGSATLPEYAGGLILSGAYCNGDTPPSFTFFAEFKKIIS